MAVSRGAEAPIPDTDGNPVVWLLYRLAYPGTWLAHRMGIRPNWISFASLVVAIGAAVSLNVWQSPWMFAVLWLTSLLLDYMDGPVARMSSSADRTALRIDHTFDLIKVSVVTFAVAQFWQSLTIWALSFACISCFFLFTVLNHDLGHEGKSIEGKQAPASVPARSGISTPLIHLVSVNGGTFLLMGIAPLSRTLTGVIFAYLLACSSLMALQTMVKLHKIPRSGER